MLNAVAQELVTTDKSQFENLPLEFQDICNVDDALNNMCACDQLKAVLAEAAELQNLYPVPDQDVLQDVEAEQGSNDESPKETVEEVADLGESIVEQLDEALDAQGEDVAELEPEAGDSPQELAQIEPAAGGDEGGEVLDGGYGFNSNFSPTIIDPIDAVGPLGPTALVYGANFPEPELIFIPTNADGTPDVPVFPSFLGPAVSSVDETAGDVGGFPVTVTGEIQVDFGGVGAGSILPNGDFVIGGSVAGDELTSGGEPVTIAATPNGYQGTLPDGTVIFELTIDPVTGEYTYQQFGPFDHADSDDPNDVIDFTFGVIVTNAEGDSAETTITINVFDDGPSVEKPVAVSIDESDMDGGSISVRGDLDIDFGADGGTVDFTGDIVITDGEGNEVPLTSGGEPLDIVQGEGGIQGSVGGEVIFTIKIDPETGEFQFQLEGPLDHPDGTNPDDPIILTFEVLIIDADGDQVLTTISVTVNDDGPSIITTGGEPGLTLNVDETDIDGDGTSDDGTLGLFFGSDGEGSVEFSTDVTATDPDGNPVSLTSGGEEIQMVSADGGIVGMVNGEVIFTLTINSETGEVEFTLLGPIDHPDGTDPNDILSLNFNLTITDGDGDSASTTVTVNVADDGPSIVGNTWTRVDEDSLADGGVIEVTDTVTIDYGADGPGSASLDGSFMVVFEGGQTGELTSGGEPVVVTQSGNTMVGMVNGEVAFTLTYDPDAGTYTYTQHMPFDHPDGSDNNDVLWLKFGIVGYDADGDPVYADISIDVQDSGPDANDDVESTDGETLVGDVTENDSFGGDGEGDTAVTQVEFNGETYEMPEDGTLTIEGEYGTLTINADGTYTYEPNGNGDGTDVFTYTITDADGDTSDATLTINVDDNDIPVVCGDEVAVDETNLGPITVDGQVTGDFGEDGPGTFEPNGDVEVSGSVAGKELTSGGEPVEITATDGGYVGMAGGEVIFTLTLNEETGEFEFTLIGTLDHGDPNDPNDVITIEFGVVATDVDGDTADATITVNIADDGPSIGDVCVSVNEGDLSNCDVIEISGNLGVDFGQDGPGDIDLTGNMTATLPNGDVIDPLTAGGVEIVIIQTPDGFIGMAGTEIAFSFAIDPDTGDYTYQQFAELDHPNAGPDSINLNFEVQVTDADGDTVTNDIKIEVVDSVPEANDDTNSYDVSDGGSSGNVITGENGGDGAADSAGDNPTSVTEVCFGDETFEVPADGSPITIEGEYGTLTIDASGEYTYELNGDLPNGETVSADPQASDVAGVQNSITLNGITISSGNPDHDLSWLNTNHLGSGIGIDQPGVNDTLKVWGNNESLDVSFDDATEVTLTLAEIGGNNVDDGIDLLVTLSDGTTQLIEFDIGSVDVVDGTIQIPLNASDFGEGVFISSVNISSYVNSDLGAASFLLNNVEVTYPGEAPYDEFTYTITDGDGDTDTATLILDGGGESDGDGGCALMAGASGDALGAADLDAALTLDVALDVSSSHVLGHETAGNILSVAHGSEAIVLTSANAQDVNVDGVLTASSFAGLQQPVAVDSDGLVSVAVDSDVAPAEVNGNVSVSSAMPVTNAVETLSAEKAEYYKAYAEKMAAMKAENANIEVANMLSHASEKVEPKFTLSDELQSLKAANSDVDVLKYETSKLVYAEKFAAGKMEALKLADYDFKGMYAKKMALNAEKSETASNLNNIVLATTAILALDAANDAAFVDFVPSVDHAFETASVDALAPVVAKDIPTLTKVWVESAEVQNIDTELSFDTAQYTSDLRDAPSLAKVWGENAEESKLSAMKEKAEDDGRGDDSVILSDAKAYDLHEDISMDDNVETMEYGLGDVLYADEFGALHAMDQDFDVIPDGQIVLVKEEFDILSLNDIVFAHDPLQEAIDDFLVSKTAPEKVDFVFEDIAAVKTPVFDDIDGFLDVALIPGLEQFDHNAESIVV